MCRVVSDAELQAVLHSHLWTAGKAGPDRQGALQHLERAYQLYKQSQGHVDQALRCCCELGEALCDTGDQERAEGVLVHASELLASNPNLRGKHGVRVELAWGWCCMLSAVDQL